MQNLFETEYTSLLLVIPANRSASLARGREPTIPDTFGRILLESSRQLDLFGASSRTSPDILVSDSPMFTEAYTIWVTQLRLDCLRRQKSVLPINGNGCLSWPTSRATDWKDSQRKDLSKAGLPEHVRDQVNWRTPTEGEAGRNMDYANQTYLSDQVNWITPKQPSGGGCPRNTPGGGLRKLEDQTEVNWPTPHLPSAHASDNSETTYLCRAVQDGLPAPDSHSTNGKSRELFPTPATVDGGSYFNKSKSMGAALRPTLGAKAKYEWKGKLNPAWVEQLMGLPAGWTNLDSSETASSLNVQKKP
ncbi:MAG: hypothetical protein MUP81_01700 [Dehalococcoidia bacterium]|nr:hypothetical protein [Dehalococcoidia bacterium]